jgi:serine/threonine-protein kinase
MDARADQFSLAAITYELLTGKMPFEGDGALNVLYKVVLEPPPTFASWGISMAPEVEAVVLRGMSKSADARFGSVLEFSDALKAAGSAGAGKERGVGHGGSGPTLPSGPVAEVSPSGFAAPGGMLAVPRTLAATPGRAGRAGALVTPRTLRMPGSPETTLRGSTGELAGAGDPWRDGNDAASGAAGAKRSKRRMRGLAIGGAGVAAVVVSVVALFGTPTRPDRVVGEPASPEVTTGSVQRPVAPSPAVTPPVEVQMAPTEPARVARRVAAAPPEPTVAPPPPPTPSHPASSRDRFAGAKAGMRSRPETAKARRTTRATSPDTQAQLPAAKAPAGETARQPGPLNSDL